MSLRGQRVLEVYGSLGIVAGIAQTIYLVAAFVLSGHLLLRAHRSRGLPQLLLGLHLLLAMGFGYLLCSTGVAIAELSETPRGELVAPLVGAGYAATILGLMAALVFNHRVFRPDRRWPLALVCLASAAMWAGWAGYGLSGGFATARFEGGWLWLMLGGMLATNGWVGIEPLLYHAQLRKRMRLGLAEPLVADRFLLWGSGSLARAAMILLGPFGELMLGAMGEAAEVRVAAAVLCGASALGLFTSVAYWLTFCPTQAYQDWVARRYARVVARGAS
jgi:hypothetical protein